MSQLRSYKIMPLQICLVTLIGLFAPLTIFADSINLTGIVTALSLSGDPDAPISVPYTGSGHFALLQLEASGAEVSRAELIVDSAASRAVLMGALSNLAARQSVILTGNEVNACGDIYIQSIDQATFQ